MFLEVQEWFQEKPSKSDNFYINWSEPQRQVEDDIPRCFEGNQEKEFAKIDHDNPRQV